MTSDTRDGHAVRVDVEDRVAILTIERPEALNALNEQVMVELTEASQRLDNDPAVGAIVVTGAGPNFAAGGDIKEMAQRTFSDLYTSNWFGAWDDFASVRTPTIAAVAGYALGGGCELAMLCDIIVAGDDAKFGQPEVKLGIPPGIGGTQRLTRAVGKAKAMEMCLTGRLMDAREAESTGLVALVVPTADLQSQARELAQKIASMPALAVLAIKECVARSYESTLSEGVLFERRAFHAAFATEDQKEGMAAFVEKRPAVFKHS